MVATDPVMEREPAPAIAVPETMEVSDPVTEPALAV
jgi:hypothetical protein